jgi:hypothetical protein
MAPDEFIVVTTLKAHGLIKSVQVGWASGGWAGAGAPLALGARPCTVCLRLQDPPSARADPTTTSRPPSPAGPDRAADPRLLNPDPSPFPPAPQRVELQPGMSYPPGTLLNAYPTLVLFPAESSPHPVLWTDTTSMVSCQVGVRGWGDDCRHARRLHKAPI